MAMSNSKFYDFVCLIYFLISVATVITGALTALWIVYLIGKILKIKMPIFAAVFAVLVVVCALVKWFYEGEQGNG